MPEIFRRSLQHRLLAAFLLMGIVPYLFIMIYFGYWGRTTIIEQERTRYAQLAEQTKQLISSRLAQLEREVTFLSQLEIFDDMIAIDVDHRISRLLEQRSQLGGDTSMRMYAIDTDAKVIASSQIESLQTKYTLTRPEMMIHHDIIDRSLIISLPLRASFDGRALGHLVVDYPLKNLKRLMVNESSSNYTIASKERQVYGKTTTKRQYSVALEGALQGYALYYSIDEAERLTFINRFMFYLSLTLLLGIAGIYYVSRRLTRQITRPVTALTHAAEEIITTQNYDLRVESESIDETGLLALMFNRLVKTTGHALERLADENQLRMQRFIDLTDMFNQITQIDDESDCIDASLKRLRSIVPFSMHLITSATKIPAEYVSVPLYMSDIRTKEHIVYGHLVIEKARFSDELEERFFISVGAMVMLQLERISLIDKIQSASDAKSTFISGMSHELRTPLNAIIGFSQYLIAYETLNDEQIDTIGKIEIAAQHLLRMINDILDIAKIEAGKIEVNLSDVTMKPLLEECVDIITPLADDNALALSLEIDAIDGLHLNTDARLFKQVIINLLSNAIKFTHSGTVRLHAYIESSHLIIEVIDTGIGIEPDDLLKVFDAFTQLKGTQGINYKGTGLGLSLSRHFARSLGAELSLESEGKGQGTVARLEFKKDHVVSALANGHH